MSEINANEAAQKVGGELHKLQNSRQFVRQGCFDKAAEEKPLPSMFESFSAKGGEALQKALAIHPVWNRFPEQDRPRKYADMNNVLFLRNAESKKRLREGQPILWPKNHPTSLNELAKSQWPVEYRLESEKCETCKGQEIVAIGLLEVNRSHKRYRWQPCPDCAKPKRLARERSGLNHRWPISQEYLELLSHEWMNSSSRVPNAQSARYLQQQVIGDMGKVRQTLFLYGIPGVGKSRLMAEIATEARQRNLSSIMRTAEDLRRIIQNFPNHGDSDSERDRKQKRITIARDDLRTADVLIIDELDDARGPAIQAEFLDILKTRNGKGLTTCFAGNIWKGNDKLGFLSDPIKDRILISSDALHCEMKGRSMRDLVGL